MNTCIISGGIVTDIGQANAGQTSLCYFTIKNETYVKGSNNRIAFIPVKFFGKKAEAILKYLKKGSNILISGNWTVEVFNDQSGQKQTRHVLKGYDFDFMGSSQNGSGSTNYNQQSNYSNTQQNGQYGQTQGYSQPNQQGNSQPNSGYPNNPPQNPQYNQDNQYNQNPNNQSNPLW